MYSLLEVFSLKRGQVFKPSSGQLYPNIGPVPPGMALGSHVTY